MRKSVYLALLGFAFIGVPLAVIATIAGGVAWFAEDADTFSANTQGRWSYAIGTAVRNNEWIEIALPEEGSGTAEEREVIYAPSATTGQYAIGESRMTFDSLGDTALEAPEGAFIGVQLVSADDSVVGGDNVFAYFEPTLGRDVWVKGKVTGSLNTPYVVQVKVQESAAGNMAVYAIRSDDETEFKTIGFARLPEGAVLPDEFVYSGKGKVSDLAVNLFNSQVISGYERWASARNVYSWSGTVVALASGSFKEFDLVGATNSTTRTTSGTTVSTIPGWEGTSVKLYTIFQTSTTGTGASAPHYLAPGYVVRFEGTGNTSMQKSPTDNFAVGGMIVESNCRVPGLEPATTGGKMQIGDQTGKTPMWVAVRKNFKLAYGGGVTFYGPVNLEIDNGVTLDMSSSPTTTLSTASSAKLIMHGAGQLKVAEMVATGAVALDFSDVGERTTPYIDGNLKIDASTKLYFPASFTNGVSIKLCSGTLDHTGLTDGYKSVSVGGEIKTVYLKFSGNGVQRILARARIAENVKWSEIVWEDGCGWTPGAPVEFEFVNGAMVEFDTAGITIPYLSMTGNAGGFVYDKVPVISSLKVPEDFTLTLVSGETVLDMSQNIVVDGVIAFSGGFNLSGSISGAGSVEKVGGGTLTLNAANSFVGDLTIEGGMVRAGAVGCLSASTVYIMQGGTFDWGGAFAHGNTFVIIGDGCDGKGAIVNNTASATMGTSAKVSLAGNASIGGEYPIVFSTKAGSLTLNGYRLAIKGTGAYALPFSGLDSEVGGTIIVEGGNFGAGSTGSAKLSKVNTIINSGASLAVPTDVTLEVNDLKVVGTINAVGTCSVGGMLEVAAGTSFGKLSLKDGAKVKAVTGGISVTSAFTQGGRVWVDFSGVPEASITILTVPSAASVDVSKFFAVEGRWAFRMSGNNVVAQPCDFGYAPIFTWNSAEVASGVQFDGAAGKFLPYDPITGSTGTQILGNDTYSYGGKSAAFSMFWNHATTNYCEPGFILRLPASKATNINVGFGPFAMGGIIMESGCAATTIKRSNLSANSNIYIGDVRGNVDSGVKLEGALTVDAFSVTFVGTVTLEGSGSLKAPMRAVDATLDFSKLGLTRSEPFLKGSLEVSSRTSFKFPAGLLPNKPYVICSGTLSCADADGYRTISVGDEEFMAYLTFESTTSGGTVRYSTSALNAATVSGDTLWDAINWNGKGSWNDGAPAVITLTGDAVISTIGTGKIPAKVIIDGDYGVMIASGDEFKDVEIELRGGAHFITASFVWTGGAKGDWRIASNWSGNLVPGGDAKVSFTNSAVVACDGISVAGNLKISSGCKVTLVNAEGTLRGVSGGNLVKSGPGALRVAMAPSGDYAFDRTVLDVLGGQVVIGEVGKTAKINSLIAHIGSGTKLAMDAVELTLSGTVAIDCDNDTTLFAPMSASKPGVILGTAIFEKYGAGNVAVGAMFGSDAEGAYDGDIVLEDGQLTLGYVAEGEINVLRGLISGKGRLGVASGVTVMLNGDAVPGGGFAGRGVIKFAEAPSSATRAALQRKDWKGTTWLDRFISNRIDPGEYGNAGSVVRFSSSRGAFKAGSFSVAPIVELLANGTKGAALDITAASASAQISIPALAGDGEFSLSTKRSSANDLKLLVDDLSRFTGSLTMSEGDIMLDDESEISIAENAVWTASDGYVSIPESSVLTDLGHLYGQAFSNGTVRYTGALDSSKIESLAGFTDSISWNGTVLLEDAEPEGTVLTYGGNEYSRIVMSGVNGWFGNGDVDSNVIITNAGLTISGTGKYSTVLFSRLLGNAPIVFEEGNACDGYLLGAVNITNFTGSILVNAGGASFGVGEDVKQSNGGSFDVADNAWLVSGRDWQAQTAHFGAMVNVVGDPDDRVLRVMSDSQGDLSETKIHPTGVTEEHRIYRFAIDSERWLVISASATPPALNVQGVDIEYGLDMTNATIYLNIADYWGGVDYRDDVYVKVVVKNTAGDVVDVVGNWVKGDGRKIIGTIPLGPDYGRNYYYEIEVDAKKDQYTPFEKLDDGTKVDPQSHPQGVWIRENASTFPPAAPAKTGEWTYNGGGAVPAEIASVVDDRIVVRNLAQGGEALEFTANTASEEKVVKVELKARLGAGDDEIDEDRVDLSHSQGSVKFMSENGKITLQAYDPATEKFYEVECVGGEVPDAEEDHRLTVTVNYQAGTLVYALDDRVLKRVDGDVFFGLNPAITSGAAAKAVSAAKVYGVCDIVELNGDQYSPYLARTTDGVTTNLHTSLDEAVADAIANETYSVDLLWDSSWRPQTNDLGRTIHFIGNHAVYIDPSTTNKLAAQGYCITTNGTEGAYTIDVIRFQLLFKGNGGKTPAPEELEEYAQFFTVTNMTDFVLTNNAFRLEHMDFSNWNFREDGKGSEKWRDGEIVDLTPYGLTNLELWAQWELAKRTIVVEPTEDYVYLEMVQTNATGSAAAEHEGVRFYADRTASFDVRDGTEIVVRFSTDIEKMISYSETNFVASTDKQLEIRMLAAELPKIIGKLNPVIPTAMQIWAEQNSIPTAQLSWPYATASYELGIKHVATEESEMRITNLGVTVDGIAFSVTIDGDPVTEIAKIMPLIRITDSLSGEWVMPKAEEMKVGADNRIYVKSGSCAFVKLYLTPSK